MCLWIYLSIDNLCFLQHRQWSYQKGRLMSLIFLNWFTGQPMKPWCSPQNPRVFCNSSLKPIVRLNRMAETLKPFIEKHWGGLRMPQTSSTFSSLSKVDFSQKQRIGRRRLRAPGWRQRRPPPANGLSAASTAPTPAGGAAGIEVPVQVVQAGDAAGISSTKFRRSRLLMNKYPYQDGQAFSYEGVDSATSNSRPQ